MRVLWILLALVGLQRVGELALNSRNQRRLLERGARLVPDDGYRAILAVHVGWFLGIVAEGALAPWAGTWLGTWPLLGLFAAAEALRLWTMATMGERWTTRVIVLPGADPIEEGPFAWMDHPIYVAVTIELFALPAAFGLPVVAVLATVGNLLALRNRIRVEESALAQAQATPDGA
jgi:methyltransferase